MHCLQELVIYSENHLSMAIKTYRASAQVKLATDEILVWHYLLISIKMEIWKFESKTQFPFSSSAYFQIFFYF